MKPYLRYFATIVITLTFSGITLLGQSITDDQFFIQKLKECTTISAAIEQELSSIAYSGDSLSTDIIVSHADLPLFQSYPTLRNKLSHIVLGDFPTPVQRLKNAGEKLGMKKLYIKQDSISGPLQKNGLRLFGGNKVRKLEFLLAEALQHHAKTILSIGGAGSNCALTATTYAHHLGLPSIVVMDSEPNCQVVRRNLLLQQLYRAELIEYQTSELFTEGIAQAFLRNRILFGDFPYVLSMGGSSPLGAVGFVNAAFELKKQIENHEIEEPDYLYVAFGSMGTTAGLMLGLKAAGLKTKVIPISVTSGKNYNAKSLRILLQKTNVLLHDLDATFPLVEFSDAELASTPDFFGKEYGLFTKEGQAACKFLQETENITLDGTYTGKACAALLHDIQTKQLKSDDVVLFWNTFCGDDFSALTEQAGSYKKLPVCFHKYFENAVQELDQ